MKRTVLILTLTFIAGAAFGHSTTELGQPLDSATEKLVRQVLPVCADMKLGGADYTHPMPQGFSARLITSVSESHACDGQYLLVTTTAGNWYLGAPWFIGNAEGATVDEKLKNFAWNTMRANVTPALERKRSAEGLFPVKLQQTTAAGKFPVEGLVDAEGKIFFMGRFHARNGDPAAERVAALQPLIAVAPSRGSANAPVTVVEFSDFQCPSCKRTSGVAEMILSQFGDKVRYVRFDLPLIESHPWAFGAALAGRAIYRQKPELFWEFKKQVYDSQDRLNAFVFDDFARGFAQDHDLDMAKYDADLASEPLRNEVLASVGAAFTSGVRATPTFMVNGVFVNAGPDGKELQTYVASQLKE